MKTIAKIIFFPLIFAALIWAALWYTRPDLLQLGFSTPDSISLGSWSSFSGQDKGQAEQSQAVDTQTAAQPNPGPMGGMPWGGMPPPDQQGAASPAWQPPMRYAPPPRMTAPGQPSPERAPLMRHPMQAPMAPPQEEDYMADARAAFWKEKENADAAIAAYKALTEDHGDNPDVWGELGNVYLSQGKMDEATEAYAKAAGLLIEQGHFRRVTGLINIIGWRKPDEALKLMGAMAAKQRENFAPAQPKQATLNPTVRLPPETGAPLSPANEGNK